LWKCCKGPSDGHEGEGSMRLGTGPRVGADPTAGLGAAVTPPSRQGAEGSGKAALPSRLLPKPKVDERKEQRLSNVANYAYT